MITRVALYVRVSSEMQMEGFSLDMQLKEMRDFAAKENWTIVREYLEGGYSAKSAERPQFQILLRDARLHMFDGLLVHKLDRLYRNLLELLQFVQMLRQQEITLVSVYERFDFNSITGEMVLSLMGGLSEVYVRNLREETMKGKYGRVLKGLWNGIFPFGYCRGLCSKCEDPNGKNYCPDFGKPNKADGKILIVHPKDGEAVKQAFSLLHTRTHSTRTIALILNQVGYRTRTKKPFTADAVCDLLRNSFYAGWVTYKGEQHRAAHPILVDQQMFDDCQAIISGHYRAKRNAASGQRFFLLSGLVRCSYCGGTMVGQTNGRRLKDGSREEVRFYRDRAILNGKSCSTKMIEADRLERMVGEQIKRFRLPQEWKERIAVLSQSGPRFNEMDRKQREQRSQMCRLQNLYVKGAITNEEYERSQKLIKRHLAEIALPLSQSATRVIRLLDDFPTLWDRLNREEQKRLIRKTVRAVYVKDCTLGGIELHELFKTIITGR